MRTGIHFARKRRGGAWNRFVPINVRCRRTAPSQRQKTAHL